MKRPLNAILRSVAGFQMHSIENNLVGAVESLEGVTDEATREQMQRSIKQMSRELCKARARYQSYLPPGDRNIWKVA